MDGADDRGLPSPLCTERRTTLACLRSCPAREAQVRGRLGDVLHEDGRRQHGKTVPRSDSRRAQDSALIRYRGPFRDSLPNRRTWAPIRTVFEKHNIAFQGAVQRPGFLSSDAPLRESDSALAPALPLRRFIRAHRTAKDRQLALAALASDGNWANRVAAATRLGNFSSSDSAWWALADALRDPEAAVSGTAGHVLSALTRGAPRRVDWAPATETLRAILDGTNLFAHNELMEVLAATQVDPALARPLLKDGGYIVLAKLGSQGLAERQAARGFLVQIAGRDLGDSPGAWREWLRGL